MKLYNTHYAIRISYCVILSGILLLTGCTRSSLPPEPARDFILVTDVANATPSSTPFVPLASTELPTQTLIPTSSPTLLPTSSPVPTTIGVKKQKENSRPQYTLLAELDYAAHTLDVEETILYTNQTGIALDKLVLVVEANRYANSFAFESLRVNDFSVKPNLRSARIEIPLGTSLLPNESVTLNIAYRINIPPKRQDDVFGYLSDYQINLVNWYPFVAPYTHQDGWILHEPTGVGEHLVYETSDFDVTLNIVDDDGLVVAASGASAASTDTAVGGTRYQLEGARTFVFSISSILSSQTEASQNASVTSFYYPNYDYAGEGILEAASQAIDIYSNRFSPYPYESLSIVQTDLPDGMEYDGLIFMGSEFYDEYDGTIRNNLISIGVHEISHQWWFGLVGSDHALEPWLDEAMALYSERIYYEETAPYPVEWWWRWRVDWFSPTGWVDTTIYDGVDFRGYTDAVYLRGAQFLEELRYRIGEKAFNAFLQDYAASYSHKIANAGDFFETLDQHTDIVYHDIVDAYFLERP